MLERFKIITVLFKEDAEDLKDRAVNEKTKEKIVGAPQESKRENTEEGPHVHILMSVDEKSFIG